MSSKYNRFLLSTCLPVMAIGLCLPLTANAGFEWTPPEKTQPVEVTPAPETTMEEMEAAVMPEPVMEEEITETDVIIEEEPPIEITVIEEDEMPVEDDVEIVVIEDVEEDDMAVEADAAPVEPQEDILIEQAETEEPYDPAVEEMVHEAEEAEEIMAEEEAAEKMEEPVIEVVESMDVETSSAPEKKNSENSLTLNPYPLENQEQEQVVASVDPLDEKIQWNVPENFAVVEGFGKEMPLALALSQIVPAEYAYSFGEGVNPGMRVSWNGGQPWNEVLAAALEPHNVGVDIRYKKVLLSAVEEEQTAAVEPEMDMSEQEVIQPEFQNDVDAVEEQLVEDVESTTEAIEDGAEEMMDDASDMPEEAPEEAMNDALREVYGDEQMEEESMPDSDPIMLDAEEDKGASNSLIEELLEPVEITDEEEAGVPKPDMADLEDETEEKEESLVERINILDPGREESVQPSVAETDDGSAEMQKKN